MAPPQAPNPQSLAADLCWAQDAEFRFTSTSALLARISGLRPEYFLGRRRWDLPCEGVSDEAWAGHRRALESRQPFREFEYALRDGSGHLTWVSVTGEPWFEPDGAFGGYRGIALDITSRRQGEEVLKDSEARLRLLANAVPGILSYVDKDERIRFVNRASESLYGLPEESVLGRSIGEISRREVYDAVRPHILRALAGEPAEYDRTHRHPDGTLREIRARLTPDITADRSVRGYFGLFTDITDLKTSQRALAESQARLLHRQDVLSRLTASEDFFGDTAAPAFARIVETAADEIGLDRVSLWLCDGSRERIECVDLFERPGRSHSSGRVLEARDYPRYFEALASEQAIDASDANTDPRTSEFSTGYLRPCGIGAMLDVRIARHDKTAGVLCCEHIGGPREWSAEDRLFALALSNLAALALEHAERRQTEATLRAAEVRFRDFARASGDWFWESNAEGRLTWVSESIEESTGTPPGWCIGKNILDLLADPADVNTDAFAVRMEVGRQRKPYRDLRFRLRLRDGIRWISNSGVPWFGADGTFLGYRGTSAAIDALVEAERAAVRSETRLKNAFDMLDSPVSLCDADDRIVLVNEAFRRQYPSRSMNVIGKTYAEYLREHIAPALAADAAGNEDAWVAARLARRRANSSKHEQLRSDGSWHLITDQRLPDGGTITFNLDISLLKQREAALEKQATLLKVVFDAVGEGISVFDEDLRLLTWNQHFPTACGGIDETLLVRGMPLRDILVAQARAGEFGPCPDPEAEADLRMAERWPSQPIVIERTRLDGRTIEVRRNPIPGGGFVSVYVDVTERKRAALELEALNQTLEQRVLERTASLAESESRLRTLLDALPHFVYVKDTGGRYLLANREYAAFYGRTPEEMVGRTPIELGLRPEDDANIAWDEARTREAGGKVTNPEQRVVDFHGNARYYFTSRIPMRFSASEPNAVLAIALDITERYQAVQDLRDTREYLETLVDLMPDAVLVHDSGVIRYANREALRLAGLASATQIIGRNLLDWFDEETRNGISTRFEALYLSGEQAGLRELRTQGPGGRTLYVEATAAVIREKGIPRILSVFRDITDRKAKADALRSRETQFRLVAEHIPANIVHFDRDLRCRYSNSHYAKAVGWTPEALAGKTFADVVGPKRAAEEAGNVRRVMAGETLHFERSSHDELGTMEITLVPYIGPDGSQDGYFAFAVDVTGHKRQEAALRDSESRLRQVIDLIPHIVRAKDASGKYLFSNLAHAQLYGKAPQDIVGRTGLEIGLPPESVAATDALDDEARSRGGRFEAADHRVRALDGTERIHWTVRVPFSYSEDMPDAVLAVGTDITDLKVAQAQIERLNTELEARIHDRTAKLLVANAELEAFSYSISHDLRAPVRAVSGFTRLLSQEHRGALPEEAGKLLDRIVAASERMGTMIDGLLELARVSRSTLKRASVDLAALARVIWEEIAESEPHRKVILTTPDACHAQCDPVLIRSVLQNLLGNAFKYTRHTPGARVEFGRAERDGVPGFYVKDNGAGFEMEYVDRLFGTFQRLHTEAEFEGTGVGLATVKRIVERHGGAIRAESVPGRGATFWFTLGANEAPDA